ncbi:segregation and condensation protein B [Luteimonas sp. RC10]|nr:segregation and condensation protein B [Luteimonas sp. RC10]
MDQTLINRIVEAALLASTQPLTVAQLGALFTLDEAPPDDSLKQALAELQAACAERGVELVELASGWRYQVKSDVHGWVARLWSERQTKYTRATLETLALIAYRQPITRGEIEQVRGVATNSNIIKALEEREWIRVVGHRDMPGRPELLGTTKAFLDYFGLKRLDELPPLSELKDFAELDPQLRLAGAEGGSDEGTRGIGGIAGHDDVDPAAHDDANADSTPPSEASDADPSDEAPASSQASPQDLPPDAPSDTSPSTHTDEDPALAADGDSDRSPT